MIITYTLSPRFWLTFNDRTGETITYYPAALALEGPRWSGSTPVPDDATHAAALGITPEQHRLAHELGHHLVGLEFYRDEYGSPIVYRDAHGLSQPPRESELEEWMVTALTYHAFGKNADYGALIDLQGGGVNVTELCAQFRWLMGAAMHPIPGINLNIALKAEI